MKDAERVYQSAGSQSEYGFIERGGLVPEASDLDQETLINVLVEMKGGVEDRCLRATRS